MRIRWCAVMLVVLLAGCDEDPVATPPPPQVGPLSAEQLIGELQAAYQARSYPQYAPLFHEHFQFILRPDPLNPGQPADWGRTEELRIHRRMFDPANIPSNETPLPMELWLIGVTITLHSTRPFQEADEYYLSATNPDGLDPAAFKVVGTDYNTSILFETRGETDYQVTGNAYFVVVQDLSKTPGDAGSFLLYRWQDLGSFVSKSRASWTLVKALYAN